MNPPAPFSSNSFVLPTPPDSLSSPAKPVGSVSSSTPFGDLILPSPPASFQPMSNPTPSNGSSMNYASHPVQPNSFPPPSLQSPTHGGFSTGNQYAQNNGSNAPQLNRFSSTNMPLPSPPSNNQFPLPTPPDDPSASAPTPQPQYALPTPPPMPTNTTYQNPAPMAPSTNPAPAAPTAIYGAQSPMPPPLPSNHNPSPHSVAPAPPSNSGGVGAPPAPSGSGPGSIASAAPVATTPATEAELKTKIIEVAKHWNHVAGYRDRKFVDQVHNHLASRMRNSAIPEHLRRGEQQTVHVHLSQTNQKRAQELKLQSSGSSHSQSHPQTRPSSMGPAHPGGPAPSSSTQQPFSLYGPPEPRPPPVYNSQPTGIGAALLPARGAMADMKEPAAKRSKKVADEKSGFDPNSYADPLEGQVDLSKEEEALPTMMQLSRPSGAPSEEQVAMEQFQLNYKSVNARMSKTAIKNGVRKVDSKAVGLMVLATQTHLKNIIDKLRQISQRRHDKDKWTDSLQIEAGWDPRVALAAQEKFERESYERKKKEEEQKKLADALEKSKRRDKNTDEEAVQLLQDSQFRHQVRSTNETVSAMLGMTSDFLKPREPTGPQAMDTSGASSASADSSKPGLVPLPALAAFGSSLQSQGAGSRIPGQANAAAVQSSLARVLPAAVPESGPTHVRKRYPPNPALTRREARTITIQDVLFYLEQNAHLRKSIRLYNAYLRLAPSNDSRS